MKRRAERVRAERYLGSRPRRSVTLFKHDAPSGTVTLRHEGMEAVLSALCGVFTPLHLTLSDIGATFGSLLVFLFFASATTKV